MIDNGYGPKDVNLNDALPADVRAALEEELASGYGSSEITVSPELDLIEARVRPIGKTILDDEITLHD